MRIEISREDDLLLDTGGGLKKASWFFLGDSRPAAASHAATDRDVLPSAARNLGKTLTKSDTDQMSEASERSNEPFFLHNVDVISTIDLHRMLQFHNEHRALATLAVQSRESSRLLLFNDKNQLVGRAPGGEASKVSVIPSAAKSPGKTLAQSASDSASEAPSNHSPLATRHSLLPLAFSGIHIISPRLLPMLTEQGVFSIIDAYLRLAAVGEKILAFRADEYYWRDLGRPADLSQAALDLRQKNLF
jgi:NDP-sugar pyrophosphorylase family protein